MSYQAEISRTNPTAFLVVVDQSGSMGDALPVGISKAQWVADVLNRTLVNLITRCTKSEGVRDYFSVGVLAYGGNGARNGLTGPLGASVLQPISAFEANPLRIEDRLKKVPDGAGGVVEQTMKFPVWFSAVANGGTPMCEGIRQAATELAAWCDAHPNSYPPTVLHVTDGESTDGDPETLAQQLGQLSTSDGTILVMNLHVSTQEGAAIRFPASESGLQDSYSKMLFRMSSQLPTHLLKYAQERGLPVSTESRGFMFNAEATDIVEFFDIGTRASQLR